MSRKVGIVGAGTMGSGIAQLAAESGFDVILWDMNESFVNNGYNRIASQLERRVERGKLTAEQKDEILARIRKVTDLQELKDVEAVIEAVVEVMDVKKDIFSKLDEIVGPETILATNTSSLSITVIAEATKRPDRVAGMHFFNPAPVMKLVEVVRGYKTSDDTVEKLKQLARDFNKEPIEVKKDYPGFIVNRIMMPHLLEAIRLYEDGVASIEDIDKAVKLGLNYPMGPFELNDFGGNDICLYVADYFYEEFKSERWAAPQTLRRMVRAGKLGRKTGSGWYDYDKK
jgi:3-hydroxybutyryl-CoA dehydrogenase